MRAIEPVENKRPVRERLFQIGTGDEIYVIGNGDHARSDEWASVESMFDGREHEKIENIGRSMDGPSCVQVSNMT
jgi:hypothetical protein